MPLIDYFLAVPLDEEWRACARSLGPFRKTRSAASEDATTYYVREHPSGDLVAAAPMGGMGHKKAALFTQAVVQRWRPRSVVVVGIAGSLAPKQHQLGDVVVATKILDCELAGIEGAAQHVRFRPTTHAVDRTLLGWFRAIVNDPAAYEVWRRECRRSPAGRRLSQLGRLPQDGPDVHFAPLAPGNEVVKSAPRGAKLRKELDKTIAGVEMESGGVLAALGDASSGASAAIVRGIFDFANGREATLDALTGGAFRAYAADNAARLGSHVWKSAPSEPVPSPCELVLVPDPAGVAAYQRHAAYRRDIKQPLYFPNVVRQRGAMPAFTLAIELPEPARVVRAFAVTSTGTIEHRRRGERELLFDIPASEREPLDLLIGLGAIARVVTVRLIDEFARSTATTWRA